MEKKKLKAEDEIISVPFVKCSFCGQLTVQGLHQVRLVPVEIGKWVERGGHLVWQPPRMNRRDFYMCQDCLTKGVKWPKKR